MLEKRLRRIPNKPVYPGFPKGIMESMVHNKETRQPSRQTRITIERPVGDASLDILLIVPVLIEESVPIEERRPAIFLEKSSILIIDSEGYAYPCWGKAQLGEQACQEKRGGRGGR